MKQGNNKIIAAVIGNPNSGKTSLFNNLTNSNFKVANWPGVTVEQKVGKFTYKGKNVELVDLPGAYSLSRNSLDEKIAADFIIGIRERKFINTKMNGGRGKRLGHGRGGRRKHRGKHIRSPHLKGRLTTGIEDDYDEFINQKPDVIINIIDSSNFERNMYLTTHLTEMGIPVIVVLNMIDNARNKQIRIDAELLSNELGVPVLETIADIGKGTDQLKEAIVSQPQEPKTHKYNERIEKAIQEIADTFNEESRLMNFKPRWIAIKTLEKDEFITNMIEQRNPGFKNKVKPIIESLETESGEESDLLIADTRYTYISEISKIVQHKTDRISKSISDVIDKIVLNRLIGIPIFLLVLFALFWVSTEVAGAGIDFTDALFNGGAVLWWEFSGIIPLLQGVFGEGNWFDIIVLQGVLGGVGTVLTFIPILYLVFFIMTFLEDFGYMARAASVMDRFMRMLGLPGKAFISFILGFGCTVPAVMSTRTIENDKERWLTVMLVPFMSCGARLPVYVFFGAIFFASWGGSLIFLLYIIGIVLAILVGLVFKSWKMKGKEVSMFVIELPPYRVPSIRNVMLTVGSRLSSFIKSAGVLITIIVLILTVMANIQLYTPKDADEDYEFQSNSRESLLGKIGEGVGYMFMPLGFGKVQDGSDEGKVNWRAGVSVFTGLFAKEAIVGTFGALYDLGEEVEAPEFPEMPDFKDGFALSDVNGNSSVKGLNKAITALEGHISSVSENAEYIAEVKAYTEGIQAVRDWKKLQNNISNDFTPFTAFLYLLFILIYTPCVAVIGATYRELGGKWAVFQAIFLFVFAYAITLGVSLIGSVFI